jgi:hypothetical protein
MNCNAEIKSFELGERREVTLSVWLADGKEFSIENAEWELSRGTVEQSGLCNVEYEDNTYKLTALVQPQARGRYKLTYSFMVADEIIRRTATIDVV